MHLSEAIRHNTTLEFLSLFHNNIGNEGGQHLVNALEQNDSLQKLELRCNPIRSELIEKIERILELNRVNKSARGEEGTKQETVVATDTTKEEKKQ